ncbi:medium-chain acyl-CoA ligase ACSF2, mitochondrial-like [Glandiceps talaboti]
MSEKILSESYIHHASNRPYQNYAVGRLLDDVTKRFPNKEALVFMKDNTRKTFQELHRDVNQIAAGFLQFGFKPGDRVGIWAEENYDWVKTDFAISTAGIVSVRLPLASSPQRLRHLLDKLACKALITSLASVDSLKRLEGIASDITTMTDSKLSVEELPCLQNIISISPIQHPGIINLEAIIELGDGVGAREELEKTKRLPSLDDLYTIMFTSGSTGLPKAVAMPNRRFDDTRNSMEYLYDVTMETVKTEGLTHPHVNTCTSGAYTFAEGIMLVLGCTIVFPYPSQNTNALLSAIQKERCNTALLFPMHFIDITNHTDIGRLGLCSLKYVQAVGNVFSPSLLKTASSLLSTYVQQIYSSIECGLVTGHSVDATLDEKVSNVGFPAFHGEVKIIDLDTGRIVPVGTTGEVLFRGSAIFARYWGDDSKTREVKTEDGWFRTGDLGKMNERGMLSIIGRKDDMIIKGARNIYPSEIEHALTDHPKIKLHKVVAVPDERFVNELCLCIVLKEGEASTQDEIKRYIKNNIDDFCIPRYILFMETFPVTETSKVRGKELAILAANILHLAT